MYTLKLLPEISTQCRNTSVSSWQCQGMYAIISEEADRRVLDSFPGEDSCVCTEGEFGIDGTDIQFSCAVNVLISRLKVKVDSFNTRYPGLTDSLPMYLVYLSQQQRLGKVLK